MLVMDATEDTICSLACLGVEVVTVRAGGACVTTIHGGALDGETFVCRGDGAAHHAGALALARSAAAESDAATVPIRGAGACGWPALGLGAPVPDHGRARW